jgi:FMN phosphatase YigB (HAD superfamily)
VLRRSFDDLGNPLSRTDLITTDVFDTLLLRSGKSRRSRIAAGEARFARLLAERGSPVPADDLVRARLLAEDLSYRALNMGGGTGEVRLADIVERQLAMLGLAPSLAQDRLAIEMAVEKTALSANAALAGRLRRQRQAGIRVVAVSDTALSAGQVGELIDHFHGPGLLDRVYSSADAGLSKRHGGLFSFVLGAEGVEGARSLHIGDDPEADRLVPERLGIPTIHVPKPPLRRFVSRADGALTEGARRLRGHIAPGGGRIAATDDQTAFGRSVFGPIVAEFCLLLWLYGQQANADGKAVMLFCARGGIGIREAFERLVSVLGLPTNFRRENLLVSRLIAARSAIVVRSPAVLDELGREFRGSSFADVASALGGRSFVLPAAWQEPFAADSFFPLLDTDAGAEVLDAIREQNDLFARHLQQVCGDATRIILCDTGLYGSTQKLLAAGFPDRDVETVQFARCSYKGLSEEHFPKVAGLVVEENLYNPFKVRTVVLRYWQIIESLFEPAIPSVRHLHETPDGAIAGNSGDIRYGEVDPAAGNPLLSGTLQYIGGLKDAAALLRDADRAWAKLKQAITNPGKADMAALGVAPRSVDFGRAGLVPVVASSEGAGLRQKLMSVKSQLWREGSIARDFPVLKPALLGALETVHLLRGVSRLLR